MTKESVTLILPDKDALYQAIDTLRVYCGIVLLSFARYGQDSREVIIRNFIARGMTCLQSIFEVWKFGSEQDAWILHRSLVDRLLHLHHLGVTNSFADFEEYSFLKKYESRNKLISNPFTNSQIPLRIKEQHKVEKSKYDLLISNRTKWKRPNAKEVAKQMDLGFLYDLGYDYASMHVHPMSDDGDDDFKKLIADPLNHTLPDATVIRNSILIQTLIFQEAFNISKMNWRAIVYNFLKEIQEFLVSSNSQYQLSMYKIGKVWPGFQLCELPVSKDDLS